MGSAERAEPLPARIAAWMACTLVALGLFATTATARADDLTVAPARDGALGAWLAAGPFFGSGEAEPLAWATPGDAADENRVPLRAGARIGADTGRKRQ